MNRFGILLLLALVPAWPVAAETARLPVFVSIPPQKYLLEQIGAEHLEVRVLLSAGANPHNYELSPRQLAALADSRAYFTIGVPFELFWSDRIQAVHSRLEFIHCGVSLEDLHHHGKPHSHRDEPHEDPHIWTSPLEARAIAGCMLQALVQMDPERAADYRRNHAGLAAELTALHEELQGLLAGIMPRYLLVQHPAWDYFSNTYDFTQVSIEQHGHEPNARHLSRVISFAREHGLQTVFVQPQVSRNAARMVADAIGGRIKELDPLAEDYVANMRRVARAIADSSAGVQ